MRIKRGYCHQIGKYRNGWSGSPERDVPLPSLRRLKERTLRWDGRSTLKTQQACGIMQLIGAPINVG
jgi:hypothetical protein